MPAVVCRTYWDNMHTFVSLERGSMLSSKHLKGHVSPPKDQNHCGSGKKNDLNVQIWSWFQVSPGFVFTSLWLKCRIHRLTPSETPVIFQSALQNPVYNGRVLSSSRHIAEVMWEYITVGNMTKVIRKALRILWGPKMQCYMPNTHKLRLHHMGKWGILITTVWTLLFGSGKAK